jgi:hypothetical protein
MGPLLDGDGAGGQLQCVRGGEQAGISDSELHSFSMNVNAAEENSVTSSAAWISRVRRSPA